MSFLERWLWELHKSPRDHIDHLMGTPSNHSVLFNKMVEEGSLVRNFRFRGFPDRGMESPRQPVTMPWRGDNPDAADPETVTVWARGYRPPSGGQMIYGQKPVDNSHRQRGLSNPPHDAAPRMWADTDRSYQGRNDGAETDVQRMTRDIMQDLQQNRERKKVYSPQRDSRQGRWSQDQYQPSFGGSPRQNGLDPHARDEGERSWRQGSRGIPVTDFLKNDDFQGQANPVQNGLYLQSGGGGERSPRREGGGIPVTDFLKEDKFESQTYPRQNGLDLQSSQGSDRVSRRGIPVTDFLKVDKFEAVQGQGRGPGRVSYRLPEEPGGDLFASRRAGGGDHQARNQTNVFGSPVKPAQERSPARTYQLPEDPGGDLFSSRRPGGGAPMVDDQGRNKTNVFGNFEKRRERSELERLQLSQRMFRDELVRGMQEQKDKRNQDVQYWKKPETDLADLMRRSEMGRPRKDPNTGILTNQHLPRSDVSRVNAKQKSAPLEKDKKMNYQPRDREETEKYRVFLRQQMEESERKRQEERQRQQQEAGQHFSVADSQWGHRGGGAPKDHAEHRRMKLDLDNQLQGTGTAQAFHKNNAPYATGFSFSY